VETRSIIRAHNGVHRPMRKEIAFHNHSKLRQSSLHPSLYSIVRNTSGEVTLTEYVSPEEYHAHRNEVFDAIARYHAHFGKQEGCECKTCQK